MEIHVLECPHCAEPVIIYPGEVACGIFRHAVYRETMTQVDPHACRELCESLTKTGKIYGCGMPFRFLDGKLERCEYI